MVIPAYDEDPRILPTLERVRDYLGSQDFSWSVTVVSDGSRDRTCDIVEAFAKENPGFALHAYKPNQGKGNAVRVGMLNCPGEWKLFSDADLATPIEEVEKLRAAVNAQIPIAIGSRPLRESRLEVRQPWYREMLGRLANGIIQMLGMRGIHDTQCGFKLFRGDVAEDIFSRCKMKGFSFDFEALMIAHDLNYSIAEVPVIWRHQEGSKVKLWRDVPRALRDLVKLRLMGKSGRLKRNAG